MIEKEEDNEYSAKHENCQQDRVDSRACDHCTAGSRRRGRAGRLSAVSRRFAGPGCHRISVQSWPAASFQRRRRARLPAPENETTAIKLLDQVVNP